MSRRITRSVAFLAAVLLVCLSGPAQADLILGLDSHDIAQADLSPVTLWDSGYGTASELAPAIPPRFLAASAALGGHPAIELDDNNGDGLTTSATGLGTDYTVMILYAFHKHTSDTARVVQGGPTFGNNWLMGPYNGNHAFFDGAFIFSGSTTTDPVILTASGSIAAANEFHLDGVSMGTNGSNATIGTLAIGAAGAWTTEPADSDLGAVLVFDQRLSNDERVGVEHFLALAFELDGFDATPAQQLAGAVVLDGFLGPIPEPGSLTLVILGISGLMGVGFRRRRAAR